MAPTGDTAARAHAGQHSAQAYLAENASELVLSGALTLASASAVYRDGTPLLEEKARAAGAAGCVRIDLAELGRVDSAALAVLVEWRRVVTRAGGRLELVNAPAQLQAIARACSLESVLIAGDGGCR